jgi:hypothetical protein
VNPVKQNKIRFYGASLFKYASLWWYLDANSHSEKLLFKHVSLQHLYTNVHSEKLSFFKVFSMQDWFGEENNESHCPL